MTMLFLPVEIWAEKSSLFGLMFMARMPPFLTFRKSDSRVFLMMPSVVSMTTNWFSLNSLTATTLAGFSPGGNSSRLTRGLPRPETPTSGTSRALSQ